MLRRGEPAPIHADLGDNGRGRLDPRDRLQQVDGLLPLSQLHGDRVVQLRDCALQKVNVREELPEHDL